MWPAFPYLLPLFSVTMPLYPAASEGGDHWHEAEVTGECVGNCSCRICVDIPGVCKKSLIFWTFPDVFAYMEWSKKPKTSGNVQKMRDLEGPTSIRPSANTLYLEQLSLASWSARNIVSLLFAFLLSLHFYLAGYRIGLSFQRRIIYTEVWGRGRIPR